MATVIDRTLKEEVAINENGQRKIITKFEAAVKQVVNKAASGDLRAFPYFSGLVRYAEDVAIASKQKDSRPVEDLTDEELDEIIRGYKGDKD